MFPYDVPYVLQVCLTVVDFMSFTTQNSNKKNTEKEINSVTIQRIMGTDKI